MDWKSIKEKIAQFAPLAGTLLGGPAGPAIGSLISTVLGVEQTPEAVLKSLNDPDQILKLKQMELNHTVKLQELQLTAAGLDLDQLRVEVGDIQNARASHQNSKMPAIITAVLAVVCSLMLGGLMFVSIPQDNRELLIQSFGTMLGFLGSTIAYWVGTNRSSALKTQMLANK